MKKYCFHPPKNIIVGTLAAMLWVAVFPFWLLGESTPLNALVSGEVPLWDTLTRLVMQDYSNITRAKWDGMLIFTMLTLLLTIPTLFRREKRRKLPLMLMLLFKKDLHPIKIIALSAALGIAIGYAFGL